MMMGREDYDIFKSVGDVIKDYCLNFKNNESVNVNDIITVTTCNLPFNNVSGIFEPTNRHCKVDLKIVKKDLSSYNPLGDVKNKKGCGYFKCCVLKLL